VIYNFGNPRSAGSLVTDCPAMVRMTLMPRTPEFFVVLFISILIVVVDIPVID
jgi:hypothetical protein